MATSKKPAAGKGKKVVKTAKPKKAPRAAGRTTPAKKAAPKPAGKPVRVTAGKPAKPAKTKKSAKKPSKAKTQVKKPAAGKPAKAKTQVKKPLKKPAAGKPAKAAHASARPAVKARPKTEKPHVSAAPLSQVATPGSTAKIRFVEEDRDPVKAAAARRRKIPREVVAEFRAILDQKRQAILQKARMTIEEGMKLDEAELPDEYDQATSEYLQYFTLRLRGREKYFLDKIEQALGRISDGTFGYCESCGDEIGMNRLRARPETTLCIRCKEAQEREERQFGD